MIISAFARKSRPLHTFNMLYRGYIRYIGVILGLFWAYIGVILGLYRGYMGVVLGLYWGYIGVVLGLYRIQKASQRHRDLEANGNNSGYQLSKLRCSAPASSFGRPI